MYMEMEQEKIEDLYKNLEKRMTNCNMNNIFKDERIQKYVKEHKGLCIYAIKINDDYKCKLSINIKKCSHWED